MASRSPQPLGSSQTIASATRATRASNLSAGLPQCSRQVTCPSETLRLLHIVCDVVLDHAVPARCSE